MVAKWLALQQPVAFVFLKVELNHGNCIKHGLKYLIFPAVHSRLDRWGWHFSLVPLYMCGPKTNQSLYTVGA